MQNILLICLFNLQHNKRELLFLSLSLFYFFSQKKQVNKVFANRPLEATGSYVPQIVP